MGKRAALDRLAMRVHPPGSPIMHQSWKNLLFLHWPVHPALLRPLIPSPLQVDTFEGQAWIGVTPFHLQDLRPVMLPAFPRLSTFNELNVRTYVVHRGVPGIWFFSLDASKLLPVIAARIFFMLPYFRAQIRFSQVTPHFSFQLNRPGPQPAEFRASWQTGNRLLDPALESLAFFLLERYCCFAVEGDSVYQIRIYHHPWILDEAEAHIRSCSMISALGIPEPASKPLAHFSQSLEVEVWPPVRVGSALAKPAVEIPVASSAGPGLTVKQPALRLV